MLGIRHLPLGTPIRLARPARGEPQCKTIQGFGSGPFSAGSGSSKSEFSNRIRIPDPGSYWHLKNQFKHLNFFHIKHISFDIWMMIIFIWKNWKIHLKMCKTSIFKIFFPCFYNFTLPIGSGSGENFPDPIKKVWIRIRICNPELTIYCCFWIRYALCCRCGSCCCVLDLIWDGSVRYLFFVAHRDLTSIIDLLS